VAGTKRRGALRLATWNINSVRLRIELVLRFLREAKPDVLALQEIKAEDKVFPAEALAGAGFPHQAVSGEKGYNGVAILSRAPLADIERRDWCAKGDRRHIAATLANGWRLHNFYVPAGADLPDPIANPKFAHKIGFLDEMIDHFASGPGQAEERAILVGDLNVAPFENDVWSHKQLLDVVSHTPAETDRLKALYATRNWIDIARHFRPEPEKLFTWWSYRAADWRASDRGRRLDHVWATPKLAPHLRAIEVFKDFRDGPSPSDHVPVLAVFDETPKPKKRSRA